ncbi:MAG: glycoside hydrolase TIM-barrel-like domain-containing protein [Rickettsiales bacterium]
MASIILSSVGSAAGAATGLPFGARVGSALGRIAGGIIDSNLNNGKLDGIRGGRLADLAVQSSAYGNMIPIIYGTVRIAGNIIWSLPIKEIIVTTTSSAGGGKGGGGKVSQTSSSYSYSVTLAVAVCEGEISDIIRIWADAGQLDLSRYNIRIYKGGESQLPDSLIQSIEGIDKTPAYRGLAYVVFEDFPLADYGNRIPNFTFEVKKKFLYADYEGETAEDMISAVAMIPAAGEFVYDTQVVNKVSGVQVGTEWAQQGNIQPVNSHNVNGIANSLLSLNQLEQTCPNIGWVSVVIAWFADNMDIASCSIKPGVEYKEGATTSPNIWSAATYNRSTARLITQINNIPQYGGTPDDASILRYLDELKVRGYNVMFYPILFMDLSGKPWRGDLSGGIGTVVNFFTKTDGYNTFINHYANLVKDKVDAFSIGSELKSLTGITDMSGNYPAVSELVSLAANVKSIVGSGVKVTYAADWSEYHHDANGWYNLDPLWASSDIDFIGIDAYFPLTDSVTPVYDIDAIKAGWTSGEGYDWYYSDEERTTKVNLTPQFAWKNLDWFWKNSHINPDSQTTGWVPQSKKIWFTEYGFPSVDGASNQPNVFYAPDSISSAFPYHSKGRVDLRAQRSAVVATESQWKNSAMVEHMFVWAWDARPFPYWPDLTDVWNDDVVWKTGHWLQGKFGISNLAAVVLDLTTRSGLEESDIDVSAISQQLEGYVITSQKTIREAIDDLRRAYFFDVVESDYILRCVSRGGSSSLSIEEDRLLIDSDNQQSATSFKIIRRQEIELPERINVLYLNRLSNYQTSTQYSQREITSSRDSVTIDLPVVIPDQVAKNIADIALFNEWIERTIYNFDLPIRYAAMDPADIITINTASSSHDMRIVSTYIGSPSMVRVSAVAEDVSVYDIYSDISADDKSLLQSNIAIAVSRMELLDLPLFPSESESSAVIRVAVSGLGDNWGGAVVYRSDDNGNNYSVFISVDEPAVIGTVVGGLATGRSVVFDEKNYVDVVLIGDSSLQNVDEIAVLNGANAALLGDEIIQFKNAELIAEGQYRLSGLLRGRLGTEYAISGHVAGERFILLDGSVLKKTVASNLIGLKRQYKAVSVGGSITESVERDFTYMAAALKPYSVVHISGARDGGGNLTISWVRRSRTGGDWRDLVDVPLAEQSELYDVEIMDGGSVVRSFLSLNSPSVGYSAAQQITDFGSVQNSVNVRIYQISAIVGRGYEALAVV